MLPMSWKCFKVTRVPRQVTRDDGRTFTHVFVTDEGKEYVGEDNLPIGAMWQGQDSHVWGIKLPGECGLNRFCPELEYDHHHWTVTGSVPRITVTPSVDCKGQYHGFITDGVVSADIEGRKFNKFGIREL